MSRSNSKTLTLSQNIVAKSNSFSMAKLSQGLTLCQTQLLMYAIFATQKKQDNIECEFKKSDFEKQFNLKQLRTNVADKDAQRLVSLSFSTQDLENEKFAYYTIFQYIKYDRGIFKFKWSDVMIPHILDLKERYIITDFEITSKFTSAFSWSLYDFIKANYGKWFISLSKEATLRLFNVEEKKSYTNHTGIFKKNVLDIAIAELNKHTELSVSYEEKRQGRSIIGFTLKWSVGKVELSATTEQMEQIHMYITTIEDDAAKYMRLKNPERFNRARELMIAVADYSANIDENLSADEANRVILRLKSTFNELERIVKEDLENKIILYNWLED